MQNKEEIFQKSLNYRKLLLRLSSFKNLYIVTVIVLLVLAFLVNRYSKVIYQNSTVIYIESNDQNSFMNNARTDLFQVFGSFSSQNIIDNEIEILRSFSLVKAVINNLDLKTSYYSYKNSPLAELFRSTPFTRKKELYEDSPIKVVIDPSVPQAVYIPFIVTFINDNEFQLEVKADETFLYNYIDDQVVSKVENVFFKNRFKFGDEIKTRYFSFRIQKTSSYNATYTQENSLFFSFNNNNDLTLSYQTNLSVEPTLPTSTLLKATLRGTNAQITTDFLNVLSSVYLDKNLEKKNKIALSTVDFIDSQLSDIADSLSTAENKLRAFRSSNSVMDLSFQGQQSFEMLNKLETEKANLETQRNYYQYLKNYLSSNAVMDLAAPSSMNVIDPILANMITQLITLNAERASLLKNSNNPQNLYLNEVNLQIDNIKKNLKENVSNTLNTIDITVKEINYRISRLSTEISQMPKTELQLKGIERKFKLNDEIYTFLLQKRSEAQIARASSMPDYEIVDPARIQIATIVSPKSKLNYIIALFLALILPTSIILGRDFLNNKFSQSEEIEDYAKLPMLGKIFHSYRHSTTVVNDHPNSSVTECFRAIRNNFQFFSEGGKKQIILVTSSASGEGKTFCSINLASVFALNGHKTIILEFDLRRPKIHQEFGSSNMIGITSYLIDKAVIEDIIMPTHIENLDLVSAGPAAPNPAELISSERTAEFIDKLKEMYDYIIIDSAPAGILTETMLLMKQADHTIFIARINKTVKAVFAQTIKNLMDNKLTNISILINDIDISREAFRYGYDKKYYTDDWHTGFFSRLFRHKHSVS
jgi:tyrosine-protein kinase Etk/Wzc